MVKQFKREILPAEDERAFEGYTLIHDSAFGYHNANRIYLIDNNGAVSAETGKFDVGVQISSARS